MQDDFSEIVSLSVNDRTYDEVWLFRLGAPGCKVRKLFTPDI